MRSMHLLTVMVACAFALSGCDASPAGKSAATATVTPLTVHVPSSDQTPIGQPPGPTAGGYSGNKNLPFPVPSTQANPIISLSMDEAWGNKLDIKEVSASLGADHMFMLKAVSGDGSTIAGLSVPPLCTCDNPAKVVLIAMDSHKVTEAGTVPSEYTNNAAYVAVALDGEWLLWQAKDTISTYNTVTHARGEIKTNADIRAGVANSYIPSAGRIAADEGRVVWAESSAQQPEQGQVASIIKMEELSTGKITVIGEHGVNPAISWPNIAWVEPDLTTEVEGQVLARLVTINMESGVKHTSDRLSGLLSVAMNADSVAYQEWTAGAGMVFLTNTGETVHQVVAPQDGATRQMLTLNDRIVAWSSPVSQVWDRKLGKVVKLGGYAGSVGSAMVSGHALAWASSPTMKEPMPDMPHTIIPDDMTIHVMDTSRLP